MKLKSLRSMTALATVALFATAANALTLKEVTPTTEQPIVSIPQDPIMLVFDGTATLSDEAWNNFSLKNVEIKDASGKTVDQGLLGTAWGADWGKICIYHDNEITTPGVYTMDINAGIIVEDENPSNATPALHIVWTIGAGGGSSTTTDFTMSHVTPENGATLEKIGKNEIFVYFPGQVMLTDEAYESNVLNCVRLKDANGNVVATSEMLWEAYMPGTDETYFNIKFNEDITADGTYTITIPAGIFAPEGKTTPTNQEVVLTYTISNPANATGVLNLKSVEPAQGQVTSLGNVFVYFDKDCDWNWDLDSSAQEFAIYDQNGKAVATTTFRGVMGGWGQPVYAPFYFNEIEADGTYTLTIPAGRFTVDGDTSIQNKEITLTWTIGSQNQGGGEDKSTYDPDFYVSNYPLNKGANYEFSYYGSAIDMVLITWKDNAVYNPNVKPYIEDANGNRIVSTSCGDFMGQTRVDFNTDETKLMKSGSYTFVVPAGFGGTSEWKASGYTEGVCNAEARVPFTYVQDPNLDDVNNDFELEVTKFGFYNGETCVVNFLDKPETCPNITGGSLKKWVFGSNKNEMSMDIYLEVLDVTDGEEWLWGAGTYRQQVTSETDVKTINGKNANNEFEVEFSNSRFTLEFLQGHQYEVRAGLYKQFDGVPESQRICYATYVARFTGTTKGYEYSPAQIVSISKPEGADIASVKDGQVTITFSEPVTISKNDTYTRFYGGSGLQAYEDIVSNADRTQWTIIPSASSLSGATGTCDYRFQAKDDAGRMLRSDDYYTSGEKANTYITLSYSCFLGGASIAVAPADGAEVDKLYDFVFTAPAASHKNIGFQGTSASGKLIDIVLKDSKGNVVATVDRKDYTATESGEYNIDCQMHLDKEITAAGEYTLCVPGAYFMTGTESSSVANKPMEFTYTIAGEVETPEEPSDFVTINFSVGGYAGLGYKTLKDKEATVEIEGSEFWRLESLSLNGTDVTANVAENGLYTIPAAALDKNVTLEAEFAFAHVIDFEFTTTGVSSIEGCKYTVATDSDRIMIDGLTAGDQVKVFSVNGMLLADKTATDARVNISVPNGTFIVLINDVALKVLK